MTVIAHIKTAYVDSEVRILKARYGDGSTALLLQDVVTGERLAKATVCMAAYNEKPRNERHVFIKDYAENQGMLAALFNAGIVDEPLRTLDAGYAEGRVHECEVLDLEDIDEYTR